MKKTVKQRVATLAFIFCIFTLKAQPYVTEYLLMSDTFKLDLKNQKVQKMVYAKGVLDVIWTPNKKLLTICYNLKDIYIEDIMKIIYKITKMSPEFFRETEAKAIPVTPF